MQLLYIDIFILEYYIVVTRLYHSGHHFYTWPTTLYEHNFDFSGKSFNCIKKIITWHQFQCSSNKDSFINLLRCLFIWLPIRQPFYSRLWVVKIFFSFSLACLPIPYNFSNLLSIRMFKNLLIISFGSSIGCNHVTKHLHEIHLVNVQMVMEVPVWGIKGIMTHLPLVQLLWLLA
jgi:hypothetical protein